MNKRPLPIATICSWESRIDTNPDYQRPPVWSGKQKQLLIDSILRNYDIPKMYWRNVERDDGVQYEVIDGQQRLRAIWEFRADKFRLAKDTDAVEGAGVADQKYDVAGQKYSDLDMNVSTIFDIYPIDVVVVDDVVENEKEDEVRDMFLRLQNGTTLKAAEKRNALPGRMRDYVKDLSSHGFFENCRFSNARLAFDHSAAQMMCMELSGGPANIKNTDLDRMYREYANFDENCSEAKKVRRVLAYLLRAFPEKTPELAPYNVVTLYCLASALMDNFVHEGTEENLSKWFIGFESKRREQEEFDEEQRDPQLTEYRRMTSSSTDSQESIRGRLEFLESQFFMAFPDLPPLDGMRDFTNEQRLAIWRRDKAICQIKDRCDGEKLNWSNWHADHVLPHSRGGKTTVSNGQVACPTCNYAKGNRGAAA